MSYFRSHFCLHLSFCGSAVSWISDHALLNKAWNVYTAPPRITYRNVSRALLDIGTLSFDDLSANVPANVTVHEKRNLVSCVSLDSLKASALTALYSKKVITGMRLIKMLHWRHVHYSLVAAHHTLNAYCIKNCTFKMLFIYLFKYI